MTAALVNVLDDPTYWETPVAPKNNDRFIAACVTMGAWAVTVLCVGVVLLLVREAIHSQDHDVKMQNQCLKAGGQWIKRDCINNLIQLH